jgi:hypothetical protein
MVRREEIRQGGIRKKENDPTHTAQFNKAKKNARMRNGFHKFGSGSVQSFLERYVSAKL